MIAGPSFLYRFLWLLAVFCAPYTLVLTVDLILHPFVPEFFYNSVGFRLLLGLIVAPITLGIGFLIIRRKPGNVVGPMLVLWGASVATWAIRNDFEITTMSVLSNLASIGWIVLIFFGFYFPTGQVVPKSWHRVVTWLVFWSFVAALLLIPASPTVGILFQEYPNPVYVPGMESLLDVIHLIITLPILSMPFVVYSMYRRYKQADAVERQQIKWLVFAFLFLLLIIPVLRVLQTTEGVLAETANLLLFGWIYLFPAVTIGSAILRHRLYDIDIIIRRTLIYSALSGLLALVFFGGVTLTQALFRSATGETSDLAIVVSTLAIAALFTPLRQRVQNAIDRRFYRRKYDAEQTLAQFAALAKDEVDVEKLNAALVGAVQETMQPRSVGVWVKE
jgi:hypothetical protein